MWCTMATARDVESILRRSLIPFAVSLSVGSTPSTSSVDTPDVEQSGLPLPLSTRAQGRRHRNDIVA